MHAYLPKYNLGVHFLTANTFGRKPYFHDPASALIFCEELEAARQKYGFHVLAFVVMPDHVHLLLWWDLDTHPSLTISKIAWAVKGKSARRIVGYLKMLEVSDWRVGDGTAVAYPGAVHLQPARQPVSKPHYRNWRYKIWQKGAGYDFNIYTKDKLLEKATYIHANPVRAGLVTAPETYPWSSASYYAGVNVRHPVAITNIAEVL